MGRASLNGPSVQVGVKEGVKVREAVGVKVDVEV
jgi:hypothetical protein